MNISSACNAIEQAGIEFRVFEFLDDVTHHVKHGRTAIESITIVTDDWESDAAQGAFTWDERIYANVYGMFDAIAVDDELDLSNSSHAKAILNRAKRAIESTIFNVPVL